MTARLTIRRIKGGAHRAYIGEQLLDGVTAVRSECVGYGGSVWTLTLAGRAVFFRNDDAAETFRFAERAAEVVDGATAPETEPATPQPASPPPAANDSAPKVTQAAASQARSHGGGARIGIWAGLNAAFADLEIAEFSDSSGAVLVRRRGAGVRLNARQAQLVRLTARGMPAPIDRRHLIARLWGATPPSSADIVLGQVAKACDEALRPEGLTMKTVRGVGIALQLID
ncbi:hypothetical protein RA307_26060 [Xanthobacteraceae bacterium Astr-EGSB]|uniref:hypothetical protein n=1 Tax=Astrobacterium formosum TaxID=3069710 RepID=UPI0027B2B787|nr:hypothetical protein [Xanthobacteraceae bacterium Astr-EGSB]